MTRDKWLGPIFLGDPASLYEPDRYTRDELVAAVAADAELFHKIEARALGHHLNIADDIQDIVVEHIRSLPGWGE